MEAVAATSGEADTETAAQVISCTACRYMLKKEAFSSTLGSEAADPVTHSLWYARVGWRGR
jgi:hypothetical protein